MFVYIVCLLLVYVSVCYCCSSCYCMFICYVCFLFLVCSLCLCSRRGDTNIREEGTQSRVRYSPESDAEPRHLRGGGGVQLLLRRLEVNELRHKKRH